MSDNFKIILSILDPGVPPHNELTLHSTEADVSRANEILSSQLSANSTRVLTILKNVGILLACGIVSVTSVSLAGVGLLYQFPELRQFVSWVYEMTTGSIIIEFESNVSNLIIKDFVNKTFQIQLGVDKDAEIIRFQVKQMTRMPSSTELSVITDEMRAFVTHRIASKSFEKKFQIACGYAKNNTSCVGSAVCSKGHISSPRYVPEGKGSKWQCGTCKKFV